MRHVLQQNLNRITTGYTVFEENQVLTAGQLNGLADYLNDEVRLTRVRLLGVGIACGLQVLLQNEGTRLVLTPGVGVTTDGDLVRIENATLYLGFKLYGETAPDYPPFFSDGKRIPAYELVRMDREKREIVDPLTVPLDRFASETGRDLREMVAVLVVESYEKDDDLCSGTDCDNLGKEAVNSIRLVLIDKADAGRFVENIPTPGRVARELDVVVVDRPNIVSIYSFDELASAYIESSKKLYNDLERVLAVAWESPQLADLLPQPWRLWLERLRRIDLLTFPTLAGFQYRYDFLKDLAETYNELRDLLFGIEAVCCPDVGAFPKHLLLGGLGADGAEPRTGFYPSPLAGCASEQRDHARFLGWKLAALIESFRQPVGGNPPIRITPSFFEDRSLEERAIPYYYEIDTLLNRWSYALERRGMSDHCYSYHAESYNAKGGAASPLTAQNGRFPFFRIEGHLAANVTSVKSFLEGEIRKHNLPICVRAVLVGAEKRNVIAPPPPRPTALHQFHQILRQDMVYQLDDTVKFGANFKQEVFRAVDAGIVNDTSESSDAPSVKAVADQSNNTLSAKASKARDKLNQPYTEYIKDKDLSWKADVKDTLKASGEFKVNLGKIVKTEFQTPIDTLISSSHVNWLNWMDVIIADQDDKEVERLLFSKFLQEHPGLEHFAGVTRGGTFVLVYDDQGMVVADFMLPYFCCEPGVEAPTETPLPKPDIKPNWIRDSGITIQASRENFVNKRLTELRREIKDVPDEPVVLFEDKFLGLLAQETDVRNRKVTYLRGRVLEPDLPADKRTLYESQLKNAEMELTKSIEDTVRHVSSTGMDVRAGTQGFRAMNLASDSLTRLTDPDAVAAAKERLTQLSNATGKQDLKLIIGGIITRKRV